MTASANEGTGGAALCRDPVCSYKESLTSFMSLLPTPEIRPPTRDNLTTIA
jgi:hypothetical protein